MTQRDLVTHLRAWRAQVEQRAHKPLADVRAPAALVLADLMAALGLLIAGRQALHRIPEEIVEVGLNNLRRLMEKQGNEMLPAEVTVLVARCVRR